MSSHAARTMRAARAVLCGAVLCGAALLSSARTVAAQAFVARVRPQRVAPMTAADAPSSKWHREQCMGGITYGAPLKLAVSYGGGLLYESNTGPDICALGVAKLGFGGAQASAGVGTSFAPWGTGIMLTGNLLRTFKSPLHATPHRTYVGASVHVWPAFALGGELGYFVRLGDGASDPSAGKRVVSWSLGFGF
ncbi:MAG: hypothetical protein IT353_19800 [Gemmatimonadaceae bacterium]|nr:hypothetical protein [Gemmatimonadaceae bacterium]